MKELIDLNSYPVRGVLKLLLADKTTKRNIVFATESYEELGERFGPDKPMELDTVLGLDTINLQPRILKEQAEQANRTKKKAEVFTPAWVCNKMNNHCDAEWFGYPDVFNKEDGENWIVKEEPIRFPEGKTWKDYIDSTRIEITCGEAPYLVSRYDAASGEIITPVKRRIGVLDRKLRVVGENTDTKEDWMKWVLRSYQSCYGYEWQGDNLLIGRINLLITFVDYMEDRWGEKPTDPELRKIANIICWNLWQMDGLTGTVPFSEQEAEMEQISFFDFLAGEEEKKMEAIPARIFDWRSNESVIYNSLKEK